MEHGSGWLSAVSHQQLAHEWLRVGFQLPIMVNDYKTEDYKTKDYKTKDYLTISKGAYERI